MGNWTPEQHHQHARDYANRMKQAVWYNCDDKGQADYEEHLVWPRLSKMQRKVFRVMTETDWKTAAELAAQIGLPPKAVRARLLEMYEMTRVRRQMGSRCYLWAVKPEPSPAPPSPAATAGPAAPSASSKPGS